MGQSTVALNGQQHQTTMWDVVSFRPGKWPLRALAAAFGTVPEPREAGTPPDAVEIMRRADTVLVHKAATVVTNLARAAYTDLANFVPSISLERSKSVPPTARLFKKENTATL
jgi:hypothetical protein